MKFKLYTDVALTNELPEHWLRRGDMLRLVEYHLDPNGEEGYSAEILGAKGQSLGVIAVDAKWVESLRDDDVLSARALDG